MPVPLAALPLHVKRSPMPMPPTLKRSVSTLSGHKMPIPGHSVLDATGFSSALRHLAAMHEMEVTALKAELAKVKDSSGAASPALEPTPREIRPRMPPPFVAQRRSHGPRTLSSTPEPQPAGSLDQPRLDLTEDDMSIVSGSADDIKTEIEEDSPIRSATGRNKGSFLSAIVEAARAETYENAMGGSQTSKTTKLTGYLTGVGLELLTSFVIATNTIVLGISTDFQRDWTGWAVIDAAFAVFFTVEAIIKIALKGPGTFCCGADRYWHVFELCSVVLAWIEVALAFATTDMSTNQDTSNLLSVVRVVRLCRITRVVRVMRFEIFLDLITMIRGAVGGLRTLLWSMVVIGVPLYAIALVFRETLGNNARHGHGAEAFGSVSESLFTMFRCIVASDCTDAEGYPLFVLVGRRYGWGYVVFYCLTTLFMMFGLFNVIVAIFVENVMSAAKTNDQHLKKQRLRDQVFLADKMVELLTEVWCVYQQEVKGYNLSSVKLSLDELVRVCAPMEITPEVFGLMRSKPKIKEIFKDLDVADEDQFNLFETLDADGSGTIDVEELCEGIAKLRGDARRSDMIAVQLMVRNLAWELQSFQQVLLASRGSGTGSNRASPTKSCHESS